MIWETLGQFHFYMRVSTFKQLSNHHVKKKLLCRKKDMKVSFFREVLNDFNLSGAKCIGAIQKHLKKFETNFQSLKFNRKSQSLGRRVLCTAINNKLASQGKKNRNVC